MVGWLCFLALLALALCLILPRTLEYTYEEGEKPVANPLKGWVRWGENTENAQDAALAYVAVHWGELEPEKGVYDFDALEERWNFRHWQAQGVHLILRVIADEPGDDAHMDIPQWLYAEMDGSGTWYDCSYGKGFSPDYTHPAMLEAHSRLLAALGERYDHEAQVAYVQLGSLGHWGEWHVNTDAGIAAFPAMETAEQYIRHYTNAFAHTPLLMRRPYPAVNEAGIGLYNDSFGNRDSDERFLSWIRDGYVSNQSGEALPACPNFWERAPSGGELASGSDMEAYFTTGFAWLRQAKDALHTSWLGPKSPDRGDLSETARKNMDALSAEMGYCYTISSMTVQRSLLAGVRIQVTFKNLGVAPMYAAWPVRFMLRDEDGNVHASWDVPVDESAWIEKGEASCRFSWQKFKKENLSLWIGIVDPMTDTCRVALANQLPEKDGMYCLGTIR